MHRRSVWHLVTGLLLGGLLPLAMPAAAQTGVAATQVRTEVVARGLAHPWALAFLPEGGFLVTERPGRLRRVASDGRLGEPLSGLPAVDAVGQGGLLDLVLDSDFARNRTLYFCYAEPGTLGLANRTALARARLAPDAQTLDDVRVIFRQSEQIVSRLHFGCRIAEAPDGTLFLTLGERYFRMQDAPRPDNHFGKVVRVTKDGGVPRDNPFASGQPAGALPEVWSMGHRNPQGATIGPDGKLWTIEHGPQGGDELNRPGAGQDHGWPVVSFGENYGGGPIGSGRSAMPGLAASLHHWTPSIAPSGMAFVDSDRYGPGWRGNLLVGSLKFRYLARLRLDGTRVLGEDKLLQDVGQRIRDVRQGPDGLIYLLTDEDQGQLLRLLPR